MRRLLFAFLTSLLALTVQADNILYVFHSDGSLDGFYAEEIQDIRYSRLDLDSIEHADLVVQEIWLKDTVMRYSIAEIDSITFKKPHTTLQKEVVNLEDYAHAFVKQEGRDLYFDSSKISLGDLPSEGQILCQLEPTEFFPIGFTGKVKNRQTTGGYIVLHTEKPELNEVFERLVFFGEYGTVGDGTAESPMRLVPVREGRANPAIEELVAQQAEGKMMGGLPHRAIDIFCDADTITVGKLNIKKKLDLLEYEDFKTTATFSVDIEPKLRLSINIAYSSWYNDIKFCYVHFGPVLKVKGSATIAAGIKDDDPEFAFEETFVPTKDENDLLRLEPIDTAIPIPDFPIISVLIKGGIFVKPELVA